MLVLYKSISISASLNLTLTSTVLFTPTSYFSDSVICDALLYEKILTRIFFKAEYVYWFVSAFSVNSSTSSLACSGNLL